MAGGADVLQGSRNGQGRFSRDGLASEGRSAESAGCGEGAQEANAEVGATDRTSKGRGHRSVPAPFSCRAAWNHWCAVTASTTSLMSLSPPSSKVRVQLGNCPVARSEGGRWSWDEMICTLIAVPAGNGPLTVHFLPMFSWHASLVRSFVTGCVTRR